MIKLNVSFDKGYKPFGHPEVEAILSALERVLPKSLDTEIGVRVTSQDKIRQLNKKYGHHDHSTDVLSFNYAEPADGPGVGKGGDIVISYEHVLKQAQAAKTTSATELALLILHGLLHIMGYDHQTKAQAENLERLQSKIMDKAGLAYRQFNWEDSTS